MDAAVVLSPRLSLGGGRPRGLPLLAVLLVGCGIPEGRTSGLDFALVPAGNLTTNPSFEMDLIGWNGFQATLARAPHPSAPDGAFVAEVTRSSGSIFTLQDEPNTATTLEAGDLYVAVAFVAAGAASSIGKEAHLIIREETPAGTHVQNVPSQSVVLEDSFQPVESSLTVQQSGSSLHVHATQFQSSVGDRMYVDLFTVVRTTAIPPSASPGEEALPYVLRVGCGCAQSHFDVGGLSLLMVGAAFRRRMR